MHPFLRDLRQNALAATLFPSGTLKQAVDRLGFVQADPIRSPARAQDLILRHRVKNYHAGDLERHYGRHGFEEDRLYAYGFIPRTTWRLLHPRGGARKLTAAERRVLDFVIAAGRAVHPRDLDQQFGRKRERNDWGGHSQATTRTLEALHYRGALRVAGRENGIRLYEPVDANAHDPLDPAERLRRLVLLLASILQPVPESTLRPVVNLLRYTSPSLEGRGSIVGNLIQAGALESETVDGLRYLWPADNRKARLAPNESVRFLAPFDPLVWDRKRFEHFWGWPYRFEAYTPAAKRQMGYYAMPMLWCDDVIGWVNVSTQGTEWIVEPGFRNRKPEDSSFKAEFDREVARLLAFLGPPRSQIP